MKFGKVLTYRDVEEAKKLIGKKVVASNILMYIDDEKGGQTYNECCLEKIVGGAHSFLMSDGCFYQFIREVIEDEPEGPHYEPYDLTDPKVRDLLRGRWFMDEYDNEVPVSLFDYHKNRNVWQVNGYSSKSFLEKCKWLDDGTPCGRRVE